VGVSPSLVSQIEHGKANPSVGTLYSIVTSLGISLDELFAHEDPGVETGEAKARTSPEAPEGGRRPSGQRALVSGSPPSPVLRVEDRPIIHLGAGVQWERLSPVPDGDVDFLLVTYDVNGSSCPPDALMRHGGREYGMVLEGQLGATVGFESYELEPGDSIVFDSSTPHRFWTIGDRPSVVIWTIIGRHGDSRVPAPA
jgi:mannose-6-phosphate isomerase-like protein (cupin superfamily)/DNA-binding XRE family transcriptional regulator